MTKFILSVVAALAAGGAAYFGNRVLMRALGRTATLLAVPWWEEACKATSLLVLPGAVVPLVHLLFGGLEFAYDALRSHTNGLFLGGLSVVSHGLVGSLASLALTRTGSLHWMYLTAGAAHFLLNVGVLRFVLPSLGAETRVHLDKW